MQSFIAANEAVGIGGGICSASSLFGFASNFVIAFSTVSTNSADSGGGLAITQTAGVIAFGAIIIDTTIIGNRATRDGGGLFVSRAAGATGWGLQLDHAFVVGNQALGAAASGGRVLSTRGGGIFSRADIVGRYTAIRENWARRGDGGGIYLQGTSETPLSFVFIRGEISLNRALGVGAAFAPGSGAGIYSSQSRLELTNLTLSGNIARGSGGALWAADTVGLLDRATIVDNRADSGASGLDTTRTSLTASLTIVGRGGAQPNCRMSDGGFTSGSFSAGDFNIGFDLEDRRDCGGFFFAPDLMVGPLRNNGGPTRTHALLGGSPALDLGGPASIDLGGGRVLVVCPEEPVSLPEDPDPRGSSRTDQRGVRRPQNTACDAGAYEREFDFARWCGRFCFDGFLWVAFGVDSMMTTSAEFHGLMVQLQQKDGAALAEQILTRAEGLRKALETFSTSQGPADGQAALASAEQDFAAIEQTLAALDVCCVKRPDAYALRQVVGLRVARGREAFVALVAAARNAALLDAVDQLMQKVRSLGLSTGLEASLLAPLEAARASLARDQRGAAVNQLKAFMQQVQALAGKQLDPKIATALVDSVNAVVLALGNQ